ncbi:MAG: hypothetical protein E7E58_08980 [Paeniclostridium sordellii]|uniref:hypothetical protein n=1 Tax=Paraclostridium sordellii TaxID=1505 RepID=UPI0005DBB6AB|nr:hypothetical protein [Paeniclostridium sordellii]AUN14342.1 hypothetical protein RSJ16_08980 [Paeniclostridium sordellii]MDU2148122.1 hypothetical protein [Paeniclostridium sordellii]CEQ20315.1 Uncharacterised protein [[Clostridium] sordellii] [Paeniclostridium sordellii]
MKGEVIDTNKKINKNSDYFNLDNLNSKDVADSFKILDVLEMVIESKRDYEKTKEEEKTKRLAIEKSTEIYLAKIKSNQEKVENISKDIFNERKKVIDRGFEVLERALDEDKDSVAIAAINGISDIVKESPLKNFDSISNALQNDDVDLIL